MVDRAGGASCFCRSHRPVEPTGATALEVRNTAGLRLARYAAGKAAMCELATE